jgi:Putative zinc-finger
MAAKHCTSEKLLAYLDNELTASEYKRVREHLSSCWACRAEAEEIQTSILRLARELAAADDFPNRRQIADARQRFLDWRESREQASSNRFALLSWPSFSPAVVASLIICSAVLAAFTFWPSRHPQASRVLARAEQSEETLLSKPAAIHEVFRLAIRQTTKTRRTAQGHLEIWSEPDSKRFAWRWKDDASRLRFAEWHPVAEKNYFFDQKIVPSASREGGHFEQASLADIAVPGSELDQLSMALAKWIRSREWRVVSIARDFASFSSSEGTALSLRRIISADRRPRFVLEATRIEGELRRTLTLEVDAASGQPLAETAEVTDRQGTVEFQLVAEHAQAVHIEQVSLEVFQPDAGLMADNVARPKPVLTRRKSRSVPPDPLVLNDAEVQVLYALHRAGLCLGVPITVTKDGSANLIRLAGLVDNEPDKHRILALISELPSPTLVRIEVKTMAEAADAAVPVHPAGAGETVPSPIQPSSVSGIVTLINWSPLSDAEKATLKTKAANVSNDLISATEALVREAWAIDRLNARFGPSQIGELKPENARLVTQMKSDHFRALDRIALQVADFLAPFEFLVPAHETNTSAADNEAGLVRSAEEVNRHAQSLFALGATPKASAAGSAQALLHAISNFQTRLALFAGRLQGDNQEMTKFQREVQK